MPVILYDTAGIRRTNNIIEKKGIELALNIIKKSNLVLNLCEDGNFDFNIKEKNLLVDNKVKIINACGFDSIPSDLGVFYTQNKMKENTGKYANGPNGYEGLSNLA